MISPSDNNAIEVASLQNDRPFPSFAPFVEPSLLNIHLYDVAHESSLGSFSKETFAYSKYCNRHGGFQSLNDFCEFSQSLGILCIINHQCAPACWSCGDLVLSSRTTRSQIQAEKPNSVFEKVFVQSKLQTLQCNIVDHLLVNLNLKDRVI